MRLFPGVLVAAMSVMAIDVAVLNWAWDVDLSPPASPGGSASAVVAEALGKATDGLPLDSASRNARSSSPRPSNSPVSSAGAKGASTTRGVSRPAEETNETPRTNLTPSSYPLAVVSRNKDHLAEGSVRLPASTTPPAVSATGVISNGVPMNPHIAADLQQTCSSCHSPKAVSPLSSTHPGRGGETCIACHLVPPVPPQPMPHSTTGYWACLGCHVAGKDGALPVSHRARSESSCVACHPASEADPTPEPILTAAMPAITPSGAIRIGPPNPHTGADLQQSCSNCHAAKAVSPLAATHPKSTLDACADCHVLAVVPPQPMPHPTNGYWSCLKCHVAGRDGALPSSHKTRKDSSCVACHPGR